MAEEEDCLLFDIDTNEAISDERDLDIENGEHVSPPRPKKPKSLCGAAAYGTKYNKDWESKFPFISRGKIDSVYSFYCKVCQKDISCRHQGVSDVKRHEQCRSHISLLKSMESNSRLDKMGFVPVGSAIDTQIKRAEVKTAVFIAHHNIPLAAMDHLSPLFRDIFPDSDIAKGFSSARTKTMCVLNKALQPHFESVLIAQMKEGAFSLAIDGSNDSGLQKMNPVTVRVFDPNTGHVGTRLLDMCLTAGTGSATAASIFTAMDNALESREIPWTNCISLSVDNTSVNMGKHNSIRSRAVTKNSSIYMMGCPCHILHNTAQKASQAFGHAVGFDVDDFLVDLFYYFDKSTKRKAELAEFTEFCNLTYRKAIKHISVRWLSLRTAVERALLQFPALKSYFISKDEDSTRFQRLQKAFRNEMTEVYLFFYNQVLEYFTRLNLLLQRDDPVICIIHDKMQEFLLLLMSKFILVRVLKDTPLSDIDFTSLENQLEDSKLQIGIVTHQKIRHLVSEGDVDPLVGRKFYCAVRCFFERAVEYSLENYSYDDELLKNASFINFEKRLESDLLQAEYFVKRYKELLPYTTPTEITKLSEEFVKYQLLHHQDIPTTVWEEALVVNAEDEADRHYRMDVLWHYIASMKCADGNQKFGRISRIAKLVLCIAHSNAGEERVFSMVRKNKTPFRPNLALDKTLPSLLAVKLATEEPCHKYNPPTSVVQKAGKVTWEYNKQHMRS